VQETDPRKPEYIVATASGPTLFDTASRAISSVTTPPNDQPPKTTSPDLAAGGICRKSHEAMSSIDPESCVASASVSP